MALTKNTAYTALILGLLKGHYPLLSKLNDKFRVPAGQSKGSLTARVLSSVAAVTPVDGTMLTNQATNAYVALTYADKAMPVSLLPSEYDTMLSDPDSRDAYETMGADALYQAAMNDLVAAVIAATPGKQFTLTAGQIDFNTDGSTAEILDNLQRIGKCRGYLLANRTDTRPEDLIILTTGDGFGNLDAIAGSGLAGTGLAPNAQGQMSYRGTPIFAVTGPSGWGGASNHAMIIAHWTALCCKIDQVKVGGGGWQYHSDGFYKFIPHGYYATGVPVQALFAEILNPSS